MKKRNQTLIAFLFIVQIVSAQVFDTAYFSQMRFRYIGVDGNRTSAVVGVAGDPSVSYVGAASGGIYKTTDAGLTWASIFDDQDVAAIGALAIAPNNPNHIWAGTGEPFVIRPAHPMGNGIYKSTDAGKTWKNMGLKATGRISRVIVHPTDSNTVYVASLGHTHAPQQERGVYRTTDGGSTWERIFFLNENTGCSDLAMNPRDPSVLYAAMWQISVRTAGLRSGGARSGIYRSKDGGKTWQPLQNGLETGEAHPVGKTSVDVCFSNPSVLYALIEDKEPRLYRSDDGGDSWTLQHQNHSMAQRAPYYTRTRVDPADPNHVFTICVTIMESRDGGKTFKPENGDYRPGGDNHDMWFDPKNSQRIMSAHDGCLNITSNGGKTWDNINLPIAQMYHISTDNQTPYYVLGNRQDGWSYRGPSNSLSRGIPLSMWQNIGGCEAGFAQADPSDPNIVWSGCYDGGLDVYDVRTGHARDVRAYPENGYGWSPAELKYRWHWNFPMVVSKHNPKKVLIGSQFVHQTTNGGQSWQIISPDLTTNDKTRQQSSGGISYDNLYTWDGCTLYWLSESPVKEGVIWAGTNDGQLQLTRNGGKTWKNLSKNLKGAPIGGTIRCIDASPYTEGVCYVAVAAHHEGDFNPYIFKTTDFGETWTLISDGIPKSNLSTVHQIKEDPLSKGLLWAGTDNALYFSPDDGATWLHLKNNLPPVAIYGIAIPEHYGDIVLGTYGRGIYILDDPRAIREFSKQVQEKNAHLFTVRKAYRFQQKGGFHIERGNNGGQNPAYGAGIHYYLKAKQKDSVRLIVVDAAGKTVQTLEAKNRKGINTVNWNLRYEPYKLPSLRTKPRGKDWVKLDSTGKRRMFIYDLDVGPGQVAPLVLPGNYVVQLWVGNEKQERILTVLKDPTTTATEGDMKLQNTFALKVSESIRTTLTMIDELEQARARLLGIVKSDASNTNSATELEDALYKIEADLHDIHATGARQDLFRNPAQVLERLLSISKEAIVSSADYRPTNQHQEVYQKLNNRLEEIKKAFDKIKKGEAWVRFGLTKA